MIIIRTYLVIQQIRPRRILEDRYVKVLQTIDGFFIQHEKDFEEISENDFYKMREYTASKREEKRLNKE